jgi:hypothetical protein
MELNIKSLYFGDVKEFLDGIGSSLVAYSLFLTILMMIFDADYIQPDNVYHKITIFLLFFILLFLGFFIFTSSNKYNSVFIKVLGVSILVFPLFLVSFLSENLQQSIASGGYTVLMVISIGFSCFFLIFLLNHLQYKVFKNNLLFVSVCLVLSVIMFFVIKNTSFVKIINDFILKIFPLFTLPDIFQVLFLGMEIGIFIGLVLAPSFVVIRKIFPSSQKD